MTQKRVNGRDVLGAGYGALRGSTTKRPDSQVPHMGKSPPGQHEGPAFLRTRWAACSVVGCKRFYKFRRCAPPIGTCGCGGRMRTNRWGGWRDLVDRLNLDAKMRDEIQQQRFNW